MVLKRVLFDRTQFNPMTYYKKKIYTFMQYFATREADSRVCTGIGISASVQAIFTMAG